MNYFQSSQTNCLVFSWARLSLSNWWSCFSHLLCSVHFHIGQNVCLRFLPLLCAQPIFAPNKPSWYILVSECVCVCVMCDLPFRLVFVLVTWADWCSQTKSYRAYLWAHCEVHRLFCLWTCRASKSLQRLLRRRGWLHSAHSSKSGHYFTLASSELLAMLASLGGWSRLALNLRLIWPVMRSLTYLTWVDCGSQRSLLRRIFLWGTNSFALQTPSKAFR